MKPLTSVKTLSLPLTPFVSSFTYPKPNNTCPKPNRRGSGAYVVFTQTSATNPNPDQPKL